LNPTYLRRRKNSAKRIGHRQKYLQVIIDSIDA
jgi:ribosomal protein L21